MKFLAVWMSTGINMITEKKSPWVFWSEDLKTLFCGEFNLT